MEELAHVPKEVLACHPGQPEHYCLGTKITPQLGNGREKRAICPGARGPSSHGHPTGGEQELGRERSRRDLHGRGFLSEGG